MEGTDREESRIREEEEEEDGNDSGDVTEETFFWLSATFIPAFSLPFSCFFLPPSSPYLGVLVNKAVCVQLSFGTPLRLPLALSLYLFSPFTSLRK